MRPRRLSRSECSTRLHTPSRPRVAAGVVSCEPLEGRRLLAADLVSVTPDGRVGDNDTPTAEMNYSGNVRPLAAASNDGRFVAFTSDALTLDPTHVLDPDEAQSSIVYVRDRTAGVTRRLGSGVVSGMSGDGRYTAFDSDERLASADLNDNRDAWVYDWTTGQFILVSAPPIGDTAGESFSAAMGISNNGRYVLFESAPHVLTGVPRADLYRRDLVAGVTEKVTSDAVELADDVGIRLPQISDDGRVIAFAAWAGSETSGGPLNVWVRDMLAPAPAVASVHSNGTAADFDFATDPENRVPDFDLSGDGTKLAFTSPRDVEPGDANGAIDLFVRDLATGAVDWATAGSTGAAFEPPAMTALSADGRFAAFVSDDDLTAVPDGGGEFDPFPDVYVHDTQSHATRLLSINASGTASDGGVDPSISADGARVMYVDFDLHVRVTTPAGHPPADVSVGPGGESFTHAAFTKPLLSRGGNTVFTASPDPVSALVPAVTDTGPFSDLVAVSLADLPGGDVQPPTANVPPLDPVAAPGITQIVFDVRYEDDTEIDYASLGTGDVVVTGPNGFRQVAAFVVALPLGGGGPTAAARYTVAAPAGVFDAGNNGTYTIEVIANEVKDTARNASPAGPIPGGTFTVNVPLGDGPDLQAVSLQAALPPSMVGGARAGKVKPLLLSVTNAGNQPAAGAVTVRVVASADDFVDTNDATVVELPNQKLKLAPGKSKVFKLKPAAFPAVADGNYRLLAVVDAGGALAERIESNNAAALAGTVRIAAPFVDLGITQPVLTGRLAAGRKTTLLVTATNGGNQVARGVQQVRVRLTTNPADPAGTSRTVDTSLKLNLKPGVTRALHAKLALPADLPAGSYFVVVELLPGASWTDPNAANDVATSAGAYAV